MLQTVCKVSPLAATIILMRGHGVRMLSLQPRASGANCNEGLSVSYQCSDLVMQQAQMDRVRMVKSSTQPTRAAFRWAQRTLRCSPSHALTTDFQIRPAQWHM